MYWLRFPFPIDWFYLKIVKVRDFKLGCTNGVDRFAYHLMCMALAMRKEGSSEKFVKVFWYGNYEAKGVEE
jgi:hypothetical protein